MSGEWRHVAVRSTNMSMCPSTYSTCYDSCPLQHLSDINVLFDALSREPTKWLCLLYLQCYFWRRQWHRVRRRFFHVHAHLVSKCFRTCCDRVQDDVSARRTHRGTMGVCERDRSLTLCLDCGLSCPLTLPHRYGCHWSFPRRYEERAAHTNTLTEISNLQVPSKAIRLWRLRCSPASVLVQWLATPGEAFTCQIFNHWSSYCSDALSYSVEPASFTVRFLDSAANTLAETRVVNVIGKI